MKHYCPICENSSNFRTYRKLPKFIFGKKILIEECERCGIAITNPPPVLLESHYENNQNYIDLFNSRAEDYRCFAKDILSFLSVASSNLKINLRGASLLDIGAGNGILVEQASKLGYRAFGIELNSYNVKVAKQRNIALFHSIHDLIAESADQKFDVLVFSAVVEHISDPIAFVKFYSKYLKPGGLLVFSQAAYDGLLPKLTPWIWYGWQPAEHFFHFNINSLKFFLTKCGAKKVYIERKSLDHSLRFYTSIKYIVGKNFASILGFFGHKVGLGDQLYAAAVFQSDK